MWREEHEDLGSLPPYAIGPNALFVCYVANAECACHLALGWPLPARILDLSPDFRNATNGRVVPEGKGLLGALTYYGLDTRNAQFKEAMQKLIIRGRPSTPEEHQQIIDYYHEDSAYHVRL